MTLSSLRCKGLSVQRKVINNSALSLLAAALLTTMTLATAAKVHAQVSDDWLFSCALFPSTLDEVALVRRYGEDNVVSAPVVGGDDGPVAGTVLFGDSNDTRVELAWRDTESRKNPAWVRVRSDGSRWKTPQGLSVGNSLRDVEAANGWPFRLGGFDLESGSGAVRSWGAGRLQKVDEAQCALLILFQPLRDTTTDFGLVQQVSRGREFSSGHPAMQALNPGITAVYIVYPQRF